MACSNRSSFSFMEEKLEAGLDNDNMSLLDALEREGIFPSSHPSSPCINRCEVGTNTSACSSRCSRYSTVSCYTTASNSSATCSSSRRSSYAPLSPFHDALDAPCTNDEEFVCFDYADEEKKRPPSDDDDSGDDEVENESSSVVSISVATETARVTYRRSEIDSENICAPQRVTIEETMNRNNNNSKEEESNKSKRKKDSTTTTQDEEEPSQRSRRRETSCFILCCSSTCWLQLLGFSLFWLAAPLPVGLWSLLRISTTGLFTDGTVLIYLLSCATVSCHHFLYNNNNNNDFFCFVSRRSWFYCNWRFFQKQPFR